MSPELIGIIGLFGTIVALGGALFGALRRFVNYVDKRFEQIERRFERIEADISKLKEGFARLEGMFEGAFERVPRARPASSREGSEVVAAAGREQQ